MTTETVAADTEAQVDRACVSQTEGEIVHVIGTNGIEMTVISSGQDRVIEGYSIVGIGHMLSEMISECFPKFLGALTAQDETALRSDGKLVLDLFGASVCDLRRRPRDRRQVREIHVDHVSIVLVPSEHGLVHWLSFGTNVVGPNEFELLRCRFTLDAPRISHDNILTETLLR
jgi:hypothetical protein